MWYETLMTYAWNFIKFVGTFCLAFMAAMTIIFTIFIVAWMLSIIFHHVFKRSAYDLSDGQREFMCKLHPDISINEFLNELKKNSSEYLYTGSADARLSWFEWYNIDNFHFIANAEKNIEGYVKIKFESGEESKIYFTALPDSEGFVHIGVSHSDKSGYSSNIIYDENSSIDVLLSQLRNFQPIYLDMTILYEIYRTLGHPVPDEVKKEDP